MKTGSIKFSSLLTVPWCALILLGCTENETAPGTISITVGKKNEVIANQKWESEYFWILEDQLRLTGYDSVYTARIIDSLNGLTRSESTKDDIEIFTRALAEKMAPQSDQADEIERYARSTISTALRLSFEIGDANDNGTDRTSLGPDQLEVLETAASSLLKAKIAQEIVLEQIIAQLTTQVGLSETEIRDALQIPSFSDLQNDQITESMANVMSQRRSCANEEDVLEGNGFMCQDGTIRYGRYIPDFPEPSNVLSEDTSSGVQGTLEFCDLNRTSDCLIEPTGDFLSVNTATLASRMVSTGELAGVTGTFLLPAPSDVKSGVQFGLQSGTTGLFDPDFPSTENVLPSETVNRQQGQIPVCNELLVTNCYADPSLSFASAETDGLASKLLAQHTLGGISGVVVLPDPIHVSMGVTFGPSSTITGAYVADFPSIANVRSVDSVNGSSGGLLNCSTDGQTDCYLASGGSLLAVDTQGLAAKVPSGESVGGITGAVTIPNASDVLTGVQYGSNNSLTGTYTPDFPDVANVLASDTVDGNPGLILDCINDGSSGCYIRSPSNFRAADITYYKPWDIRRKRAPNGSVITFAGIEGRFKTCRNTANLTIFDNTTAPAIPGLDPYDTIEDCNSCMVLERPPSRIPWQISGVTGTFGDDFACGGIYSTGDTTTGATGADPSLQHDPNGNWQDLTPGIVPGGAPSTNPLPGCNALDKHCVFRELISGLLVSEVANTNGTPNEYNWQQAIEYCATLGDSVPIPTYPVESGSQHSDWRLPVMKELTHLSNAAIRGLQHTWPLANNFGRIDGNFWSSTTLSTSGNNAFGSTIPYGSATDFLKASRIDKVICVK